MWPARPYHSADLVDSAQRPSAFSALKLLALVVALALPGGALIILAVASYPQTKRSVLGS